MNVSREGLKRYFLQSELLRQHRLALRQTLASIECRPLSHRDRGRVHFAILFNFIPGHIALLFPIIFCLSFDAECSAGKRKRSSWAD